MSGGTSESQKLDQFCLDTLDSLQQLPFRKCLRISEHVLAELREQTGWSAVLLFEVDDSPQTDETIVLRASAGQSSSLTESVRAKELGPVLSKVHEELPAARPVSIEVSVESGQVGFAHCLAVPLMLRGALAGLLVVASKSPLFQLTHVTTTLQRLGQSLLQSRRTALQRLAGRRERRLLKCMSAHAGDMAVLLNADGRVLFVVSAGDRPIKLKRQQALESQVHPDDCDLLSSTIAESQQTGALVTGMIRLLDDAKYQVIIEARRKPMQRHRVVVFRKFSGCGIAHQEALDHELIRASRLRLLARMSADCVHQLNQPLQVLMADCDTMAAQLKRGIMNRVVMKDSMERLASSTQAFRDTVQQLSRFSAFRELSCDPVSLRELLEDSAAIAASRFASGYSVTSIRLPSTHDDLRVDVDRLHMIDAISQLIMNAVEASQRSDAEQGHVSIRVDNEIRNHFVAVEISDQGPGISFDPAEHLFEGHESTREDGCGLGLSICHDVVVAHGGQLHVRNAAEAGCVVTLTLPVHRSDSDR